MAILGTPSVSGVLVHVRRRLSTLLSVAAASALVALSPADAAEDQWSPLQEAEGSTLAIALDDQTTALLSVGGADDGDDLRPTPYG